MLPQSPASTVKCQDVGHKGKPQNNKEIAHGTIKVLYICPIARKRDQFQSESRWGLKTAALERLILL